MNLSSKREDAGGWVAAAEKEQHVPACHKSVTWGLRSDTICSMSSCLEILKSVRTDVITVN